jgi:hypothetical protein
MAFEFLLVSDAGTGFAGELDLLGAQGWEAVSFDQHGRLLMQRTLPDPDAAPVEQYAPYLSGTPIPGAVLSCTHGEWDGSPFAYEWQWLRDGDPIGPLGPPTYHIGPADVGHEITCTVTATNLAGSTTGSPSNPVEIVAG